MMCNDLNDLEASWACTPYEQFMDDMRYEENARYDQYDGMRGDVDCNDDPGCPVCGDNGDCAECIKAKAEYERRSREAWMGREACADDSDVPF